MVEVCGVLDNSVITDLFLWDSSQPGTDVLLSIHTLQLDFLFSDWFCFKYAECIENAKCTVYFAQTARGAFVRDRRYDHHIDQYIFALGKVVNILCLVAFL